MMPGRSPPATLELQLSVYWGDPMAVRAVPKAGGSMITLIPNQLNVADVAVDATHVFWLNYSNTDGRIRLAAKDGTMMRTRGALQDSPSALVVDSQAIYWASQTGLRVYSVPR